MAQGGFFYESRISKTNYILNSFAQVQRQYLFFYPLKCFITMNTGEVGIPPPPGIRFKVKSRDKERLINFLSLMKTLTYLNNLYRSQEHNGGNKILTKGNVFHYNLRNSLLLFASVLRLAE